MSDSSFRAPSSLPSPPAIGPLTRWLIVILAAIGFAFDIYEILMMQYVGPEALKEFLPGRPPTSPEVAHWRGMLFFVPAFAGGIFGLLGGYLTDLLGRRRVLTASILLYATSAFLSGFSTSLVMLLVFRCFTFVGVCVEFVAAVAWLAELFPEHQQRERALGYTQAFSSIGGLIVSSVYLLLQGWAEHLPAVMIPAALTSSLSQVINAHASWRYLLMSGVVPAIPLIFIRPFLPESPVWHQKKIAGTLKRPSIRELFGDPQLRRTTLVTTLMFACSYGVAFGAIQQVPEMVAAMPTFQEKAGNLPPDKKAAMRRLTAGQYGTFQEVGGLVGRFVLAYLAVIILSRRSLLRVFQLPGLIIAPLAFAFAVLHNRVLFTLPFGEHPFGLTSFHIGIFLVGLFTVAQFSFWGNYLPTVYPVHLRGTGEGFAANIGGRMIGTSFAWVTSAVATLGFIPGGSGEAKMAYTAAGVTLFLYLAGSILCSFLPEPKEERILE